MRSALFASLFFLALVSPAQQPKTEEPIYPIKTEGLTLPKAIHTPEPDIPKGVHGTIPARVVLSGYVGIDGKYHDPRVLRSTGIPSLDTRAQETVKKWKFHPCTKDGKKVNCEMYVEVAFNFSDEHR